MAPRAVGGKLQFKKASIIAVQQALCKNSSVSGLGVTLKGLQFSARESVVNIFRRKISSLYLGFRCAVAMAARLNRKAM